MTFTSSLYSQFSTWIKRLLLSLTAGNPDSRAICQNIDFSLHWPALLARHLSYTFEHGFCIIMILCVNLMCPFISWDSIQDSITRNVGWTKSQTFEFPLPSIHPVFIWTIPLEKQLEGFPLKMGVKYAMREWKASSSAHQLSASLLLPPLAAAQVGRLAQDFTHIPVIKDWACGSQSNVFMLTLYGGTGPREESSGTGMPQWTEDNIFCLSGCWDVRVI